MCQFLNRALANTQFQCIRCRLVCVARQTRKNAHITKLMAVHKEEFSDIKNYFSDIIHNNIDLIRQLKVR